VRRILTLMVATAVVAATAASLASANATRAKLQLRKTKVGTILVNSRGFTVYAFTRDTRNRDACVNISSCLTLWPVVGTSAKAIAGRGVNSRLIGTITLKGGVKQVTYAGHPLYTYIGDTSPGETFYVNFFQLGGHWPALNASGQEVK
jgi:predicted lipoprotein with Yx(FWY)xxD motif